MALTAIALASRALIKLGAAAISSFEDGTAESQVAAALYDLERDALLASHPWSFATGQATLPRLVADPVAEFDYAFQLPTDLIRVLRVTDGDIPAGRYRILERRLHANAELVTLTYIFRPDETAFPPWFDAALVDQLAAAFCLPLTENAERATALAQFAELRIRQARLLDSQQAPGIPLADFPLISVRG